MIPLPAISPDHGRAIWTGRIFAGDEQPPGLMVRDAERPPQLFDTAPVSLLHNAGKFFITSTVNESRVDSLQVRHFGQPEAILVEIDEPYGKGEVTGDRRALNALPAFINMRIGENWLQRHNGSGRYEPVETPWFSNDGYDVGYQGPLRPAIHKASNILLIGIQRSGHFVICDPDTGERRGVLELAQGRGNPNPVFDATGRIWTIDYDTLVRLEADLTVSGQVLVQPGTLHDGRPMSRFAGELALSEDEKQVFVTRPFSGDIAVFDTGTLELVERLQIGGEPLFIGFMRDGLVTLEWKTGEYRFTAFG